MGLEWYEQIPGVRTEEALFDKVVNSQSRLGERVKAGAVLAAEAAVIAGAALVLHEILPLTSIKVIPAIEGETVAMQADRGFLGLRRMLGLSRPTPLIAENTAVVVTERSKWLGLGKDVTYDFSSLGQRVAKGRDLLLSNGRDWEEIAKWPDRNTLYRFSRITDPVSIQQDGLWLEGKRGDWLLKHPVNGKLEITSNSDNLVEPRNFGLQEKLEAFAGMRRYASRV